MSWWGLRLHRCWVSPWAGTLEGRFGARRLMVASDLLRTAVVIGVFFADSVWQIYALAVLLNLGSAIFTPIHRAVIPGVLSSEQYPRARAIGSIAYDAGNILGPSLAALVIAVTGFRGNFVVDTVTFLGSAALVFGQPRLAIEAPVTEKKAPTSMRHGLAAMFQRKPLRESLYLAFQTSIVCAFIIVARVDYVKKDLHLGDSAYAWVMAHFWRGFGGGSVALQQALHTIAQWLCHRLRSRDAGCKAGWGLRYPLAGFITTALGFRLTAGIFAALIALVSAPGWFFNRPE
jgi:MFS family permease